MRVARWWALTGSVGLVVSFVAAGSAAASVHPTPAPHRMVLRGSLAPAQARSHPAGSVAAGSQVKFDLVLSLRNAAGAQAFVREVSTPGSATYRHFLSDAAWQARFGPTQAAVAGAESWLRQQGFTVGSVPKDRLLVPAQGSALRVERAFGVQLGYYRVNGHTVRLAKGALSVPSSLAGAVSGVVGVNEYLAANGLAGARSAPAATRAAVPSQEPPPPAGSATPSRARRTGGRRSTPRTRARCTSPTPTRSPMTSAGTSRGSSGVRTGSARPPAARA